MFACALPTFFRTQLCCVFNSFLTISPSWGTIHLRDSNSGWGISSSQCPAYFFPLWWILDRNSSWRKSLCAGSMQGNRGSQRGLLFQWQEHRQLVIPHNPSDCKHWARKQDSVRVYTACLPVTCFFHLPKGSITSKNSAISWILSVQRHEPMGNILH